MLSHRILAGIFYKPFPGITWQYSASENVVYLTFDDGPYPPVTKPLLEMLNALGVPATFFLSGESLFRYRRELSELDYSPHQVGSHFYRHVSLFFTGPRKLQKGLRLTDRLISRYLRRETRFFRPPYGIFNPRHFPTLQEAGKKMVLWSLMAYDFKWEAGRILRHLCDSARPGDIIVFHDSPKTEKVLLEVLPRFIDFCRERGWGFGQVNQDRITSPEI